MRSSFSSPISALRTGHSTIRSIALRYCLICVRCDWVISICCSSLLRIPSSFIICSVTALRSILSRTSVRFSGSRSLRRFFADIPRSEDTKSLVNTSFKNLWFISSIMRFMALVSSLAEYNSYSFQKYFPFSKYSSECWIFSQIAVSIYLRVDSSSRNDASAANTSGSPKLISPSRNVPPYLIYSSILSIPSKRLYSLNGINVVWIIRTRSYNSLSCANQKPSESVPERTIFIPIIE